MLNVISALEKISINAQLMCEVASNKCEVLADLGINNETIRTLTTEDSNKIALQYGHEIQSLFIVVPRTMKRRGPQENALCG
ncbi:hypothetical protein [Thalassotalea fusca]